MGKSYRKTPIHGMVSLDSEKEDKKLGNRRFRKHVSDNLSELKGLKIDRNNLDELDELINFEEYEAIVSDWDYEKDGKNSDALKKIVIDDEEYDAFEHNPFKQYIQRSVYESIMRK